MKKIEKEMVVLVVKLFRTGKLNFTYSYSPSYWEFKPSKDDHEFVASHDSLTIELRRSNLIVHNKETADKEGFVISLTKELKQIYRELYQKHEAEIKEVLEAQKSGQKQEKRDTKLTDSDKSKMLEKFK